ncbi:MAG: hypothetical protein GY800_04790 [Planctomycetes bacterium]|nr:hypothetical protein [Planctomycetota bacterium]
MAMDEKEVIDILNEINKKLGVLVAIISSQGKDQNTQIGILTKAGLSSEEMSSLTGVLAGTIRRRRSQHTDVKKARKKSK